VLVLTGNSIQFSIKYPRFLTDNWKFTQVTFLHMMLVCRLSVRKLCIFLIPFGELFQMKSLVPLQKISISSLVRFIISFSATFVKAAIPAPGLTLLHSDLAVYPVICWHSLITYLNNLVLILLMYFVLSLGGLDTTVCLLTSKLFVVLGGFFILLDVSLLLTCMVIVVGIICYLNSASKLLFLHPATISDHFGFAESNIRAFFFHR
jgi:hypothetical protein